MTNPVREYAKGSLYLTEEEEEEVNKKIPVY